MAISFFLFGDGVGSTYVFFEGFLNQKIVGSREKKSFVVVFLDGWILYFVLGQLLVG